MTLDLLSRIQSADFTRLKSLSLTRELQVPDDPLEVFDEDSMPEDREAFRPLLAAVQELLPSVVEFIVTCGRTMFLAERIDEQKRVEVESGGWLVTTISLVLSQVSG